MEIPDIRRRVRTAIEMARRNAQERRARTDQAAREYEAFLQDVAAPAFHVLASALVAEGHRFKVFTPAGSVRLAAESSADDFLEIALDSSADPPVVVLRTSRGRGRRLVTSESPIRDGVSVAQLTEEDVVCRMLAEIVPFVER